MVMSKSVSYFSCWVQTTLTTTYNSGLLMPWKKVADFCAIDHTTVAIICKALHDSMLFFVEGDILVPILHLSLTIIMGVLQLSFCICGLPGHMVRAKKTLVDIKEHSLTVLCSFSLLHIDKSIHVCDHLRENLVHHCIVNLDVSHW